ncbi:MAG: ABC transporter ATP-binding protein [Afipia sp.]|jgi:branched-chain amino acid transport system ATP-binding protein|nr:ABC transporter ATP-binding protein [Rhodospirillales bacterium]MBN9582211.1 ABC transporter ATP-binding protein [Afipia sp.]
MTGTVLELKNISKRFGGFKALTGVSFDIALGERIGVLGPNGAGKSTLVNCIAGTLACDTGVVVLNGQRVNGLPPHKRAQMGLARTFQIPRPYRSMTVFENVSIPIEFLSKDRALEQEEKAYAALRLVGLESKSNVLPEKLSQVELRKLELAKALALDPSLLIADEVMAGLSASEVDEIVALLRDLNGRGVAVLLIEHIMRAVVAFAERVIVLVTGETIADGPTAEVMKDERVVKAYLGE